MSGWRGFVWVVEGAEETVPSPDLLSNVDDESNDKISVDESANVTVVLAIIVAALSFFSFFVGLVFVGAFSFNLPFSS